ncbi:MAG: HIT family protein [bacterium]|nr:HIT family protein [bacterium]
MTDCIFCKIIAGELPSTKVYEDDHCLAFLDIRPVTKGHTLVVPKGHVTDVATADPEVMANVSRALPKIARAVVSGVNAQGFNCTTNNGAVAGQIIFHLHFHIIPRFSDDGLLSWHHGSYKEGEQEQVGETIRSQIV